MKRVWRKITQFLFCKVPQTKKELNTDAETISAQVERMKTKKAETDYGRGQFKEEKPPAFSGFDEPKPTVESFVTVKNVDISNIVELTEKQMFMVDYLKRANKIG